MTIRESRPAANGAAQRSGRTGTEHIAYDRLLGALRSAGKTVEVNGTGAMAQCPAHNDNRPSLSLKAIEGSVLLYCFAGCEAADVTTALGLTPAALFDSQRGQSYAYPDGRKVDRSPTKQFKQRGNTKGTALYNSDQIADASTVY
ncbi:MAG TPA: hypothetical protein VML93_34040, partial [Mycobacterium sp.]|nr:hypothetical protein [Mycobacterium sp.]